jgi:hypothetical protein
MDGCFVLFSLWEGGVSRTGLRNILLRKGYNVHYLKYRGLDATVRLATPAAARRLCSYLQRSRFAAEVRVASGGEEERLIAEATERIGRRGQLPQTCYSCHRLIYRANQVDHLRFHLKTSSHVAVRICSD